MMWLDLALTGEPAFDMYFSLVTSWAVIIGGTAAIYRLLR